MRNLLVAARKRLISTFRSEPSVKADLAHDKPISQYFHVEKPSTDNEDALEKRIEDLGKREMAFKGRESTLEKRIEDLDKREMAFKSRESILEKRIEDLDKRKMAFKSRESILEKRIEDLDKREMAFKGRESMFGENKKRLTVQEKAFAEWEKAIGEHQVTLIDLAAHCTSSLDATGSTGGDSSNMMPDGLLQENQATMSDGRREMIRDHGTMSLAHYRHYKVALEYYYTIRELCKRAREPYMEHYKTMVEHQHYFIKTIRENRDKISEEHYKAEDPNSRSRRFPS
ncbi:hypothetical protein F4779DRAFT_620224 [Xylariaceae sp. FL0662B]|nr:hypothetical protein F4779DRAFT_620224 [Xylariaceae sp. FL0662B]